MTLPPYDPDPRYVPEDEPRSGWLIVYAIAAAAMVVGMLAVLWLVSR